MKDKSNAKKLWDGVKAAFPFTVPIFLGWIFVGLTYGVLMNDLGYNALWAALFSVLCMCGGMQMAAVPMMAAGFDPLSMFIMSYFVNFRHTFYGIPMLEKYKGIGWTKFFNIYNLSDESFSVQSSAKPPEGVEEKYFYFGVTLLCMIYWPFLTCMGGLIGSLLTFDTTGLDFALTALFIVLFLQQWNEKENRPACIIGIAVTLISLLVFGQTVFLMPALGVMLLVFWLMRNKLGGEKA